MSSQKSISYNRRQELCADLVNCFNIIELLRCERSASEMGRFFLKNQHQIIDYLFNFCIIFGTLIYSQGVLCAIIYKRVGTLVIIMFALRHILSLLILISSASALAFGGEAETSPTALEPDQLSSECLSCHEDINETRNRSHGLHVTGIPYEDYTGGSQKFRIVSALALELILLEGRITCATCHGLDPHDGQVVVIDNRRGALCNSCHNM